MNTINQNFKDQIEVIRLVRAAQEGDRGAFGELFSRYERHVFAVAMRRMGDYNEAQEVTTAAREAAGTARPDNRLASLPAVNGAEYSEQDMPAPVTLYGCDPLVRRSVPLQRTSEARRTSPA